MHIAIALLEATQCANEQTPNTNSRLWQRRFRVCYAAIVSSGADILLLPTALHPPTHTQLERSNN